MSTHERGGVGACFAVDDDADDGQLIGIGAGVPARVVTMGKDGFIDGSDFVGAESVAQVVGVDGGIGHVPPAGFFGVGMLSGPEERLAVLFDDGATGAGGAGRFFGPGNSGCEEEGGADDNEAEDDGVASIVG